MRNVKGGIKNVSCFEFFCTKCQQKLKINTNTDVIDAVLKHYRHLHTSYDRERRKVSKWLSQEDVLTVTGGNFKSFGEILSYYSRYKKIMGESEKKYLLSLLQTLRNLGPEKARKHYNTIALLLASKDLEMFNITNQ
jgi:hypothetical protein